MLESIRNIAMIFGTVVAMYYTFILINRFHLDSKINTNKLLKDQYDVSLTALNNADSESSEYNDIQLLVEERKYKALIGVPTVTNNCAKYLLSLDDRSRFINLYIDAHKDVEFNEEKNKFEYGFGLRTTWIRKLKIWGGVFFYFIFAIIAIYTPILFDLLGSNGTFEKNVYDKIVANSSAPVFGFIAIIWLIFWGYTAYNCIKYAAKINLAEKLVDQKPDFTFKKLFKRKLKQVEIEVNKNQSQIETKQNNEKPS